MVARTTETACSALIVATGADESYDNAVRGRTRCSPVRRGFTDEEVL
ncbi:hypothetical protein [Mycolicibacterium moriokaense]|nr:hypothetical protein [Mycolicibacterium moriokaense]